MVTSVPRLRAGPASTNDGTPFAGKAESITPSLRWLLTRMWQLGFGTITGLHVRAGDPQRDPAPMILRTFNCSKSIVSRQDLCNPGFSLRLEQIAFQQELAAIADGVINVIKVHDGLPVVLEIQEPL